MFVNWNSKTPNRSKKAIIFLAALLTLTILIPGFALANPCSKKTLDNIRGSLELSQGRGGIWGYMEKTSSMKKDSMLGFQVDSKLQRFVVGYENICLNGKTPSKEVFNTVMGFLDQARVITNKNPGRTSPKKIMTLITSLNKDMDTSLSQLKF